MKADILGCHIILATREKGVAFKSTIYVSVHHQNGYQIHPLIVFRESGELPLTFVDETPIWRKMRRNVKNKNYD